MNVPKVQFGEMPISQEIDWMYNFLFCDSWGWGKYIIKKHPKIKSIFLIKNKTERIKFLKNYITVFKQQNRNAIEQKQFLYQKNWQIVEKPYFKLLADIMQIDWPRKKKIIRAKYSIDPICPRFLDSWSFALFCNYDKPTHVLEVIMHECCHFLYFEKWHKLYPKMNARKFDFPYLEWHLSEIIAPVILNDDRVQKLLKQKAVFYPEHQKIKINSKSAPKFFTDLYLENKKENGKFGDFLSKSYKIIQTNRKLFNF